MYLNTFAQSTQPLDMTTTDEFRSLLTSAADLAIPHAPAVPYRSCNIVLRQQRFHFLEWGHPDAPPIVLLHGGQIDVRFIQEFGDGHAPPYRAARSASKGRAID